MVKIKIIAIGKSKETWVTDACHHFEKLLSRFAKIEYDLISPLRTLTQKPAEVLKKESEVLFRHLEGVKYFALSDTGRKYDSMEFSRKLQKWQTDLGSRLCFVIGGPYGLDDEILKRASEVLSLSSLTFSHQLVRLILLEQLYRAFSIIHGTDYHK